MLLTPKEVAEKLRVSEQTVLRWLRKGKLKGVKVGKLWRVREEDLRELIKEVNNG
ncbi:MAG: helix-turn-helix domain-containing protein [Atribacterota bacterium]|nr:helix-turn-helix domain-containing protein [Atribacterota bacterium]